MMTKEQLINRIQSFDCDCFDVSIEQLAPDASFVTPKYPDRSMNYGADIHREPGKFRLTIDFKM